MTAMIHDDPYGKLQGSSKPRQGTTDLGPLSANGPLIRGKARPVHMGIPAIFRSRFDDPHALRMAPAYRQLESQRGPAEM
jgi:hypothetical protein